MAELTDTVLIFVVGHIKGPGLYNEIMENGHLSFDKMAAHVLKDKLLDPEKCVGLKKTQKELLNYWLVNLINHRNQLTYATHY